MPSVAATQNVTLFVETRQANAEVADRLSCRTVDACVGHFGDRVRSVVLTGSLARNEGSFLQTSKGWELLGDAEYLILLDNLRGVDRDREMRSLKRKIEDTSTACGLKCSVSLGIADESFFRKLKPHIFAYELRTCGQAVFGDPNILGLIPAFSAADIPLEDGWRLLANRIVEQLEVLAVSDESAEKVSEALLYRTVKLYLDMATSLLLFLGRYEAGYGARCERLRRLSLEQGSGCAPFKLDLFADQVEQCTRWKLSPGSQPEPDSRWNFWLAAHAYATKMWNWELGRLQGEGASSSADLLMPSGRRQPILSRLRGWAHVVREAGWQTTKKRWPAWLMAAAGSSPRDRVYSAAADLYFLLPAILSGEVPAAGRARRMREIQSRLPLADLSPDCGWRALARGIAWNYHLFLENTRS